MAELDEAILALLRLAWLLSQAFWEFAQVYIATCVDFYQQIKLDLDKNGGLVDQCLVIAFLVFLVVGSVAILWPMRACFWRIWVIISYLLLEVWLVFVSLLQFPWEICRHFPYTPWYIVWLWRRRDFYLRPFRFVDVFRRQLCANVVIALNHSDDGDEVPRLDWNPYIHPHWLWNKFRSMKLNPINLFKKTPKRKRKLGIDAATKERILAANTPAVNENGQAKSKRHARVDSGVEL